MTADVWGAIADICTGGIGVALLLLIYRVDCIDKRLKQQERNGKR